MNPLTATSRIPWCDSHGWQQILIFDKYGTTKRTRSQHIPAATMWICMCTQCAVVYRCTPCYARVRFPAVQCKL